MMRDLMRHVLDLKHNHLTRLEAKLSAHEAMLLSLTAHAGVRGTGASDASDGYRQRVSPMPEASGGNSAHSTRSARRATGASEGGAIPLEESSHPTAAAEEVCTKGEGANGESGTGEGNKPRTVTLREPRPSLLPRRRQRSRTDSQEGMVLLNTSEASTSSHPSCKEAEDLECYRKSRGYIPEERLAQLLNPWR